MMTVTTLTDGGQEPVTVARALHDFLAAATTSLDLALYDFKLGPGLEELVVDVIDEAGTRGVAVRLMYNADFRAPIPVPPPPQTAPEDVARLSVPTKPIAGDPRPDAPQVRRPRRLLRLDGVDELDRRLVVTGGERRSRSIDSPQLARAYTLDFEQLWASGNVEGSGHSSRGRFEVDGIEIRPWFCPGFGDALSHRIAKAIGRAKRRVRICSPVHHRRAGARRRWRR